MPASRFERFLPIAGVLAGLVLAVGVVVAIGAPNAVDDAADRFRWLADHQAAAGVSGIAYGYFAVLMLLFVTGIRQVLRSGEPGESTYSAAAFGGGILVALVMALQGVLLLAAASAADKGNEAAVTTLGFIDSVIWVPWAASSAVLFLAAGLGGLRTATLPRWLSIATVVLGVLCVLGPTGIAVFLLTPLWLVVTGIVLARRSRATATVPAGVAASYAS